METARIIELLERDSFLSALEEYLREAARGDGRLVMVMGEAGIGKTSLVQRFAGRRRADAIVLRGACDALSTPRPLGPLFDVASAIGGELERLAESDAPREQLFRASLAALGAGSKPHVLIVEDVHWADEATLDWIRYLARRIGGTGALVVLTCRDDEIGADHPMRAVLGDIATVPELRRMKLPPLTVNAVERLVEGTPLDGAEIHGLTGGNAFFVSEIVAAQSAGVPSTVRDAVQARTARLSEAARIVLGYCALIGLETELNLFEKVQPDHLDAIDECLAAGVLMSTGGAVAFRHELARLAVADSISPARARHMHRDILRALADVPSEDLLSRLAYHAEESGDGEATVGYAIAAAERSSRFGAHRESAAQYARALRFSDLLTQQQEVDYLERRSYECYLTGQLHESIEARRAALELRRALGDRLLEGDDLRWLSRLMWFLGRNADAVEAAEESIRLLEPLPPGRELAMAYSNRAHLHMLSDNTVDAVRWGERAIALAEQLGDHEILAHALNNVGTAQFSSGNETGSANLEQSLRIATEHNLEEHVARAWTNLASISVTRHELSRAGDLLREGISYSIDHDLDFWREYMLSWKAWYELMLGRWDDASRIAHSLLRNPDHGTPPALINALVVSALVEMRRRAGGDEALDRALAMAVPTAEAQRLGPVRAARAEAAWIAGNTSQQTAEARLGLELLDGKSDDWLRGQFAAWLWRAGALDDEPMTMAEPFALSIAGEHRRAAELWDALGCPYEAALARTVGDEDDVRAAFVELEQLGATAVIKAVSRDLRARGAMRVPRGPRSTTRANPLGLTAREMDVLSCLDEGLSNAEIADRLVLSRKTIEHHVSAILTKLGVNSRSAAVHRGRTAGAIPQDRQPADPK
jgi:DNA-binding CsgD family transcriptional regulator